MKIPRNSGIYVISDCKKNTVENLLKKTEKILETGISLFQFRDKYSDYDLKKMIALKLQALCKKYDTPFIVNDDVMLAETIQADGVHLGKNDMPIKMARKILGKKIIGISCYNSLENAVNAELKGANYVALGSFFDSPTKPDAKKIPIELLSTIKSRVNIPIVAIGGITPENGKYLMEKKVDFLAIISGIYESTDIVESVKAYNKLF
ncbi:MAG: thiamine phosphate synthase [Legionellales bacterium]|nr:thiamine phosphate synthase [Legionellales bacterium]|tara:strand:+ start:457 stop:1077 length:621 start_codon:yes stop_codon:yes gene_type:complete